MTKMRRFRADYIFTEDATGVGITEHDEQWNEGTIAIHSFYLDKRISNQDASVIIFRRIYNDLKDGESALLQMSKYSYRKGYDMPYRGRVNVKKVMRITGLVYQPSLLASDSIRRKTEVSEVFSKPTVFNVIQTEKEEREANE